VNLLLVAPLLLSVVGGLLAWWVPRVASPSWCVRSLTAALVVSAGAIVSALVLVAVVAASQVHVVSHVVHWCTGLEPGDRGVSLWAGAVAVVALGWGGVRVVSHLRQVRSERRRFGSVCGVEVVDVDGPVAFAVPGRPGGVVIGRQLLSELRADERAAVLAHERAHLEHGHHRFVLVAEMCALAFPFLAPLARQVRFNTERWADESAAIAVGSRKVVARAIVRTALVGTPSTTPQFGLAMADLGAAARVEALVRPSVGSSWHVPAAAIGTALFVAGAGASVQVHHLAVFILHICSS